MGHVHYRVRRPRHGRQYRAPATQVPRAVATPRPQPPAISTAAQRAGQAGADRRMGPRDRSPAPAFRPAAAAKALIIGLLCLQFLAAGRFMGIPFALVLIGFATIAFARHHRRQAFGERRYRGHERTPGAALPRARTRAIMPPTPRVPARPQPASPYNLDEYLRRLHNDGGA